jgi:hypothetical protein
MRWEDFLSTKGHLSGLSHPRSGSLFGFEQLRKVRTDETSDCARLAWLEVMKANSTQLAFITSS